MDVKFTNTTSSKLSGLSITNGQLIALSDKPQISYDLGGVRKSLTVSDDYTSSAGTAAQGVAASSYALATAYNELKTRTAVIMRTAYQFQTNHIYVKFTDHDAWCSALIVCYDGLAAIRYRSTATGVSVEVTQSTPYFKVVSMDQTSREVCFNTGSWYFQPTILTACGIDYAYTLT